MKKVLVPILMFLLGIFACSGRPFFGQDSAAGFAEKELRAALCDMAEGEYAVAQSRVERVLESEPHNVYAQRLLPGLMAGQIRPNDKSPENLALIRKTMTAYQQALNNLQSSTQERESVDKFFLSHLRMINEENFINELLKRASDLSLPAIKRGEMFVILASNSWDCAYKITTKQGSVAKAEVQQAKECVIKGLDYVDRAIELNADDESGWSYKVNLLLEASRLAGMENNQTQKTAYQIQYDQTLKHLVEISARREKQRLEKQKEEEPLSEEMDDIEQIAEELTEYKAENTLDELIGELFFAGSRFFSSLDPEPLSVQEGVRKQRQEEIEREQKRKAVLKEKYAWKTFSPPDEEIIVDLPDNVKRETDSSHRYIARSEGVVYRFFSQPRASYHTTSSQDDALNAMTWAFISNLKRFWSPNEGNVLKAKLIGKETVSGVAGKVYSYEITSCHTRIDGILAVYLGKKRYYQLFTEGASQSDTGVQRFLKSIRFR